MSLDDIWAEPIVETTAGPSNLGATASTSRPALFLSDSEDEDSGNVRRRHVSPQPASPVRSSNAPQGPGRSQLDAMFAGLDDDNDDPFGDVAPAVDIERLKRQADAKVAAAKSTLPSTSSPSFGDGTNATRDKDKEDKGTKTQRVIPKLDAERLLGRDGFPRLLNEYKTFKVTGKGHESADLEKLFRIYHAWTHKMYPKFQFRDTVERIERLCRSRRMAVNLKVWRDEAHGITPEVRHKVSQANDGSGSERDSENEEPNIDQSAPGSTSPSSSRPSTPVMRPGSAASTAPSVPSSATDIDNDMDIDALLREEEEIMREMNGGGKEGSSYKLSNTKDNEETLWTTAGGIPDGVPDMTTRPGLTGPTSGEADDEDMWDMFDEMENQGPPKASGDNEKVMATSELEAPSPPAVSEQPTIGADWDDMYE